MDVKQAYALAKQEFESSFKDFSIYCETFEEPIAENASAYVFGCQSKKFLRTRNLSDMSAGGCSMLVDKRSGKIFRVGPYIDEALLNFELHGDPYKRFVCKVQLIDWHEGANKIFAIKALRKYTKLGLRDTKLVIDTCLRSRKPQAIETKTLDDARSLTDALQKNGFIANHIAE